MSIPTRQIDRKEIVTLVDAAAATAAADLAAATPNLNTVRQAVAVTATAAGTGTGIVPDGADFATVTSANADHIVTLPTPTVPTVVSLRNGATGYELRSSDPETVAINGGVEADAESAIGANVLVVCRCDTATTWVCTNYAADGTVTATQVAAAA